MVNYTKRAVRGAGITLIMSILAAVVAYVTRLVLARNLSVEEYGLFYSVFTFIILFLFFRDLGLGQALVKYMAEFKVNNQFNEIKTAIVSVFSIQLFSSIIFVLIFIFSSSFLAQYYFKNPQASLILRILVFYVIFSVFFIIVKQIFQGFQEMFFFSSMELMKNLIVLVLILIFFYFGQKSFAPVYAYALVCPLLFLIYAPFLFRKFNFFSYKVVHLKKISKKLFLFGIPVFATSIGGKLIGYIDTIILTYFGTLSEVGVYNAILPSALIFLFFSKAISAVLFPLSSELWAKKDQTKLSKGLTLLYKYTFVTIIPFFLIIYVYTDVLIVKLFGLFQTQ